MEQARPAGEDPERGDEKQPLLARPGRSSAKSFGADDLRALRDKVSQQGTLDAYKYLEFENLPEYMVMQSIINAVFAVIIVLGAYWFVISVGDRITPLCKPYAQPHLKIYSLKEEKIKENLCYTGTYCFWTYPIICPLAIIYINWRNLVDKRMFYECLMNRIFLLQSRVSWFWSKTCWFLSIYGGLALSSVLYMDTGMDEPLHAAPYWKYKEVVFGMLAYFSAVGAFLRILFTQWSVNNQIITLSNFVRYDGRVQGDATDDRDTAKFQAAVKLMNECKYVSAEDFESSWEHVEEIFEEMREGEERMIPEMSTPELLQLTLDQHEKWKGYEPTFIEQAGRAWRYCFTPKQYWVNRFFYFEHLDDSRSYHFKFCVKFYALFTAISVILFCWGMFYTTSHYLIFQFKDLMPPELRRLPAPHEAPEVYDKASKLIPAVARSMKDLKF